MLQRNFGGSFKTIKMKTNRIIVIVNQMIETADEDQSSKFSHHNFFRAYRDAEDYSLCWDDIFIGTNALWTRIHDRIEEYSLLSHLRSGSLELVYYSPFDKIEALFTSTYKDHLQFFDESVPNSDLEDLRLQFYPSFSFEFTRVNHLDQLFPEKEELPSAKLISISQEDVRLKSA